MSDSTFIGYFAVMVLYVLPVMQGKALWNVLWRFDGVLLGIILVPVNKVYQVWSGFDVLLNPVDCMFVLTRDWNIRELASTKWKRRFIRGKDCL